MEEDDALVAADEDKKKKGSIGNSPAAKKLGSNVGGSSMMRCCQADKCSADLNDAKQYHRRHKVCEQHAKSPVVIVAGLRQRFCQQCSRFHELMEFDEAKRSCRRRLAGHNERRRKNSSADQTHVIASEGSSRKVTTTTAAASNHQVMKDMVYGQDHEERGSLQISIQENTSYKHFQIG